MASSDASRSFGMIFSASEDATFRHLQDLLTSPNGFISGNGCLKDVLDKFLFHLALFFDNKFPIVGGLDFKSVGRQW